MPKNVSGFHFSRLGNGYVRIERGADAVELSPTAWEEIVKEMGKPAPKAEKPNAKAQEAKG